MTAPVPVAPRLHLRALRHIEAYARSSLVRSVRALVDAAMLGGLAVERRCPDPAQHQVDLSGQCGMADRRWPEGHPGGPFLTEFKNGEAGNQKFQALAG